MIQSVLHSSTELHAKNLSSDELALFPKYVMTFFWGGQKFYPIVTVAFDHGVMRYVSLTEKISCFSLFCLVVPFLCDFHKPSHSIQLGSFLYSAITLFLGKKKTQTKQQCCVTEKKQETLVGSVSSKSKRGLNLEAHVNNHVLAAPKTNHHSVDSGAVGYTMSLIVVPK